MMMGVKMIKTTIMTESLIMTMTKMTATTVAIVVVPMKVVVKSNTCTIESNITF
jgi:hypothetical protein